MGDFGDADGFETLFFCALPEYCCFLFFLSSLNLPLSFFLFPRHSFELHLIIFLIILLRLFASLFCRLLLVDEFGLHFLCLFICQKQVHLEKERGRYQPLIRQLAVRWPIHTNGNGVNVPFLRCLIFRFFGSLIYQWRCNVIIKRNVWLQWVDPGERKPWSAFSIVAILEYADWKNQ